MHSVELRSSLSQLLRRLWIWSVDSSARGTPVFPSIVLATTSTHGKVGDIPTTSLPSAGETGCDCLQLMIAVWVSASIYHALGPQACHRGVLGNGMKVVGHGRDEGFWHRSRLFPCTSTGTFVCRQPRFHAHLHSIRQCLSRSLQPLELFSFNPKTIVQDIFYFYIGNHVKNLNLIHR